MPVTWLILDLRRKFTVVQQSQCPVCSSPLESRAVTPCYVCGGWSESMAEFDPVAEFREYRLPNGRVLVLCGACAFEEFMMPGGLGHELIKNGKLPLNSLQRMRDVEWPETGRDMFCPACNLRLAFLKIIAENSRGA